MKEPTLLSKIIECKEKTNNDFVNLQKIAQSSKIDVSFNQIINEQEKCLNIIKELIYHPQNKDELNDALLKTTNRIKVEQNILRTLLSPVEEKKVVANEIGSGFLLNKIVKTLEVDSWSQYNKELSQEKQEVSASAPSFDLLYIFIGFIVFIGVSRFVRTKILKKEDS